MAVSEHWVPPPAGWPSVEDVEQLQTAADVVLLPDRVDRERDGALVAAFREEAQALRVEALRAGFTVELARPAEATLAAYREHAAEWVLPLILSVPAGAAAQLVANFLQRRLDELRSRKSDMPRVRYRELI
jgi:hypothetical protein